MLCDLAIGNLLLQLRPKFFVRCMATLAALFIHADPFLSPRGVVLVVAIGSPIPLRSEPARAKSRSPLPLARFLAKYLTLVHLCIETKI